MPIVAEKNLAMKQSRIQTAEDQSGGRARKKGRKKNWSPTSGLGDLEGVGVGLPKEERLPVLERKCRDALATGGDSTKRRGHKPNTKKKSENMILVWARRAFDSYKGGSTK